MFPLPSYRGKTVGILGLGPNGVAAAKALKESGATVLGWDGQAERRLSGAVDCLAPKSWPMEHMHAVILADGGRGGFSGEVVDRALSEKVPVLTDIDLFSQALNRYPKDERPKVVAVTGQVGKSVTVSIIAHILKEQGRKVSIGGQVGTPFLALPPPEKDHIYLLELPVRRLSTTHSLHADISVVLNISSQPQLDSIELALRSLMRIFKTQGPTDTAIIGVDDVLGQKVCTLLRSRQLPVSKMGTVIPVSGEATLGHGIFALNGIAYSGQRGKTKILGDFTRAPAFVGAHFNQDAAAAMATCISLGVDPSMIIKSLHSYAGLTGRFECIGTSGSVIFVDDSYASTVAATQKAIAACPDVFWIGGNPQGAVNSNTERTGLAAIHGAYLLGQHEDVPHHLLKGMMVAQHLRLEDAVTAAVRDAELLAASDPGASPVVLFSPAIPPQRTSFRRDDFRTFVSAHIQQGVI
ncbi:MAG: Mur ligase family protein [Pseudomonadota bacterium]